MKIFAKAIFVPAMIRFYVVLVLSTGIAGCQPHETEQENPLTGAWQFASSTTIAPDGTEYPSTSQENILLFTDSFYSMNRASGEEPFPFYEQRFQPTESEKIARYNTLLVNAGRYTVTDSTLEIQPLFALVPEYVNGSGTFDYSLSNDTLTLDWKVILSADSIPDPYTSQGYHFKYEFVRIE